MDCKSMNLIYQLQCTECIAFYIGETRHSLSDHMNGHYFTSQICWLPSTPNLTRFPFSRHWQSCGLTMPSHNATRNAHDVMWKQISWQRQRRTCYRVQYHNVAWCSIYECLFELSSTTNILHCHLVHNKNTSPPTILEMYVSLSCFHRDMFRSKYAKKSRPWSFSMHCRWRHWGRRMYLLPLQVIFARPYWVHDCRCLPIDFTEYVIYANYFK